MKLNRLVAFIVDDMVMKQWSRVGSPERLCGKMRFEARKNENPLFACEERVVQRSVDRVSKIAGFSNYAD